MPRTAKGWSAVGGALVGVLLVSYAAVAVVTGGQVPWNTKVLGIDIGGLSEEAARAKLDRDLAARARQPLAFRAGAKSTSLDPRTAGLAFDSAATVKIAMRNGRSPLTMIDALLGGRTVRPLIRVDQSRLQTALNRLNTKIGTPAREGRVVFQGTTPQAVLPRDGSGFDPKTAAERIKAAYLTESTVSLPVGPLRPKASAEAVRQAAAGPARTAVSGPVTFSVDGKRLTMTPATFARHLQFIPDTAGTLQPRFDGKGLATALGARLERLQQKPKDATYVIKKGAPRLVPSREGKKVEPKALATALSPLVTRPRPREAAVPLSIAKPRLSTEQAARLGIKEKISTFTTRHPCCAPRVTNIHTIAKILDGYVVKPGETFSLNGIVGKRDKARGFVEAPMILEGRFVDDVGGGVSQFATTMFNAVFFGGLQDVQHMPHSYYISRYPAGRESTVSYPQPDFRWRNDSPNGVLVDTSFTGTSITVTFWGTKRYDIESKSSNRYAVRAFESKTESGPKCTPMPGAEGFRIDVWRIFKQDGKVVRRQKFHTNYLPEPRITCRD
ncbi:VanW family protein [Actinomadura rudentiformis]|uniref:VanW family protein n=1 Tax=Actinomadura rudentiformis TaxID=359158 RepID=UPI00178C1802|nr:VanW family protein [Actinomadura rudentiformis]